MLKQIAIVAAASILLGGCGLVPLKNQAASDQKPEEKMVTSPSPTMDPVEAMPSPGSETDSTSLETDIESTTILEEDFSDLE